MKVSVCTSRPILSPCGLIDIEYQVAVSLGCEHYCYYCYALPLAETDWSKEILIFNNIADQLISKELHKIPPQTIYKWAIIVILTNPARRNIDSPERSWSYYLKKVSRPAFSQSLI